MKRFMQFLLTKGRFLESKATQLLSAITQRRFVLLFVVFRSRKEISSLHDREMKHEIIV
jgi:hypothetical protein